MIRRFLIRILVNGLAIWAADWLLAGLVVSNGWMTYALAGLALGALNAFVRPILRALTLPVIWLTLGLFSLVINGLMIWLTAKLVDGIAIADLTTLAMATLVVALVNLVLGPSDED